jgi:hypothetical protein
MVSVLVKIVALQQAGNQTKRQRALQDRARARV